MESVLLSLRRPILFKGQEMSPVAIMEQAEKEKEKIVHIILEPVKTSVFVSESEKVEKIVTPVQYGKYAECGTPAKSTRFKLKGADR